MFLSHRIFLFHESLEFLTSKMCAHMRHFDGVNYQINLAPLTRFSFKTLLIIYCLAKDDETKTRNKDYFVVNTLNVTSL